MRFVIALPRTMRLVEDDEFPRELLAKQVYVEASVEKSWLKTRLPRELTVTLESGMIRAPSLIQATVGCGRPLLRMQSMVSDLP